MVLPPCCSAWPLAILGNFAKYFLLSLRNIYCIIDGMILNFWKRCWTVQDFFYYYCYIYFCHTSRSHVKSLTKLFINLQDYDLLTKLVHDIKYLLYLLSYCWPSLIISNVEVTSTSSPVFPCAKFSFLWYQKLATGWVSLRISVRRTPKFFRMHGIFINAFHALTLQP